MPKYIVTLCVALFSSSLVLAAPQDEKWAVENEAVQVDEEELRLITKTVLQSGQLQKDGLNSQNVENIAKNFILYKALAAEAQKLGLDQTPEVQKQLEMDKDRLLGGVYLNSYLNSLDLPDFNNIALENYKLNKAKFMRPERVKAQHILIHFDGDVDKSKLLAQEVRTKVIKAEQGFADLAREYSNDSSAKSNGGSLGFFDKNQMVPEFSKAAFSLKEGDVSEPVKTQFGWHIIQVLEKQPAKLMEFSEVKGNLIRDAEHSFKQNARGKKLNETVYTPGLKVNEELIKKITNDLISEQ